MCIECYKRGKYGQVHIIRLENNEFDYSMNRQYARTSNALTELCKMPRIFSNKWERYRRWYTAEV